MYGLTAQLLSAAAMRMAQPAYESTGVLAPVQAMGIDVLEKELLDNDVEITTYGPTKT